MKTTVKILAVFALALLTFGQHTGASAGSISQFRGASADADWSIFDPTGCIFTSVYIFANEEAFQEVPDQTRSSQMGLFMSRHNNCTGVQEFLGDAFVALSREEFKISGDLSQATLKTTVDFFDSLHGTSFDVFIDLTWTGVGPLFQGSTDVFHLHSLGCNIIGRHKGTVRSAVASGSISDGTTNFTPELTESAIMVRIKEGQVSVGCD